MEIKLPLPFRLLGMKPERVAAVYADRVHRYNRELQRPLTQDEIRALTEHSAHALYLLGNLSPFGLGLGFFRAYQTRAKFRFPFYQPKSETFNSSRFLGLEGPSARTMWQLLRFGAYGSFGMFFGILFAANYAASVAAVRESRDPRLEHLQRAIMEKARSKIRRRMGASASDARGDGTEDSSDDASPTSGYDGDKGDYNKLSLPGTGNDDGRMLSDREMRSLEVRQQPSSRDSPTSNTSSTFEMDKVARQPQSFDDTFDDTSPTAGSQPLDRTSSDMGGGSTWDRLRRQAGSSPSSSPSSSPPSPHSRTVQRPAPSSTPSSSIDGQESIWAQRRQKAMENDGDQSSPASSWSSVDRASRPTSQDSFSFSPSEQERQLAKAEAQRAFDEQVERERRGGQ